MMITSILFNISWLQNNVLGCINIIPNEEDTTIPFTSEIQARSSKVTKNVEEMAFC